MFDRIDLESIEDPVKLAGYEPNTLSADLAVGWYLGRSHCPKLSSAEEPWHEMGNATGQALYGGGQTGLARSIVLGHALRDFVFAWNEHLKREETTGLYRRDEREHSRIGAHDLLISDLANRAINPGPAMSDAGRAQFQSMAFTDLYITALQTRAAEEPPDYWPVGSEPHADRIRHAVDSPVLTDYADRYVLDARPDGYFRRQLATDGYL